MNHIKAPVEYLGSSRYSVFLAGGITGCPMWQEQLVDSLGGTELSVINPRRDDFDVDDPSMMQDQINWEFRHLQQVRAVSFWFPKETLCPITLFELGAALHSPKIVLIGMHPDYVRRKDVEIQSKLVRPWVSFSYSVEELSDRIRGGYKGW